MTPARMLRAAALVGCLMAFATTAYADGRTDKAASFIRLMADQMITVLSDGKLTTQGRKEHFRDLLRQGFAVELMGRFAVGPYWRQMSPEQRREYLVLFVEFALNSYADKLSGYSGESMEILETIAFDENDTLVRTAIVSANGNQTLNFDWRVRTDGGDELRVIDVMVDGLSLLLTHRAEFTAVIRKQGVDGLFELLRARMPAGSQKHAALQLQ